MLAEGPVGYARLARAMSEVAARGGEGRAPRRARRARRRRARARAPRRQPRARRERLLVRAHRLPQGHGAGGAARRRPGRGAARARPAHRRVRARPRARRAVGPRRPARPPPQRRARRGRGARRASTSSPPTTCTTPPPRRRPLATALAAVRARRSLDEIDGWLPAGAVRAPASAGGAGSAASPAGRARWSARVELAQACAFDLRLAAPELPDHEVPARSHRDDVAARAHRSAAPSVRYPPSHEQHEQACARSHTSST